MPFPLLTVTPATIGNAQIQAALIAGQALCDPTNRGRHVIPSRSKTANAGKIVFQQGPGNGQNPPWSSTSFAGGTVTANGDILCVLASIIRMIGDSVTTAAATVTPGTLATNFNYVTGTPPSKPYNTRDLLRGILNSYELVIREISPRGDFFQYILDYTGYVILFGKGGSNNSPPFITNGHWVYIRSYDPATDLYYIGQSFGNQGALLDHVRGYRFSDLVKLTAGEGGVITAFGTIENLTRREARESAFRAANPTLPSTAYIASSRITQLAKNIGDSNRFQWLGLGTTVRDRDERTNRQTPLQVGGQNRKTFFDKARFGYTDTTWGDSGTGRNDGLNLRDWPSYLHVPAGVTREGYGIFKNVDMEYANLQALQDRQPPPFANILFIRLQTNPFGDEGDDDPALTAGSLVPYTTNPDGSTILPVAADRYVVNGTSPEGYAVYINLSQVQRAGNISGAPRFIQLDGNYVPYIIIPNPANTGPGSTVPSQMTQIAPGNHTIYKYDKNNAFIANISIPGAVAAAGQ